MNSLSTFSIEDELIERATSVVNALRERQLSLVTAESCTGGLLATVLSQVPGAAAVFHGSFVTYSSALKAAALDVSNALLRSRGGVNDVVALSMARGAIAHSPAQLAVSITGVLGPEPDEDGNPAGLIYIATAADTGMEHVEAYRLRDFGPDLVCREAVMQACKQLERGIAEYVALDEEWVLQRRSTRRAESPRYACNG